MHYLLPKLLRSGRTAPSCSKRCNYIKQRVLSKRIQPNLVKNIPNLVTLTTTKYPNTDPNVDLENAPPPPPHPRMKKAREIVLRCFLVIPGFPTLFQIIENVVKIFQKVK